MSHFGPGKQCSNMTFLIRNTSSATIPPQIELSRRAPRPLKERQRDYVEKFDYKTLFYDIFESGDRIRFSGPPLRNLEPIFQIARYTTFGRSRTDVPEFRQAWKTQNSSFASGARKNGPAATRQIAIEAGQLEIVTDIQTDDNYIFDNKKVLFTLSKNNDLTWIRDWAKFYSSIHGVNAILFYDNGSDAYKSEEILDVLSRIDGIDTAVVVNWPFKYGPGGTTGTNWDSDYCQYSAIEHARWRFLQRAAGALNNDIDELVVSNDGRSVFDWLAESKSGAIAYAGRWILNVGNGDGTPLHSDFRYSNPSVPACTKKWCVDPRRMPQDVQWNVHSFGSGFSADSPEGISHRHFVGINSNWKRNRTTAEVFDPAIHELDKPLSAAFDRVFGAP